MKIPRNVYAKSLIKALRKYGYEETRQVGSHIRLTTELNGLHKITIPNHKPIKVGTLSAILTQIGNHHRVSKEDLIKELF